MQRKVGSLSRRFWASLLGNVGSADLDNIGPSNRTNLFTTNSDTLTGYDFQNDNILLTARLRANVKFKLLTRVRAHVAKQPWNLPPSLSNGYILEEKTAISTGFFNLDLDLEWQRS